MAERNSDSPLIAHTTPVVVRRSAAPLYSPSAVTWELGTDLAASSVVTA
jgi:hypothetical protein